jgi:FixJ family two-component response regulator
VSIDRPLIAVVDDDPSVCTGVHRLLLSAGLQADTFTSGADFLASLATVIPDCLVLDLSMPNIDGLEVQSRLRRIARVPIVFISAQDSADRRRLALAAGAFAFLAKPFDRQLLLDTIVAAMKSAG